ncbi:hypothetical protein [Aeoliella sp. SH292]|jgi:hypothetical protein|uniref:hypothetical protein n=1 Tax=Aeoliella sp. SH292 TaxID=3454464 RepID=UPI003F9AA033
MFARPLVRLSIVACLFLASGCTTWKLPQPNLNFLRDPRAVDVDNRLSGSAPSMGERVQ